MQDHNHLNQTILENVMVWVCDKSLDRLNSIELIITSNTQNCKMKRFSLTNSTIFDKLYFSICGCLNNLFCNGKTHICIIKKIVQFVQPNCFIAQFYILFVRINKKLKYDFNFPWNLPQSHKSAFLRLLCYRGYGHASCILYQA